MGILRTAWRWIQPTSDSDPASRAAVTKGAIATSVVIPLGLAAVFALQGGDVSHRMNLAAGFSVISLSLWPVARRGHTLLAASLLLGGWWLIITTLAVTSGLGMQAAALQS